LRVDDAHEIDNVYDLKAIDFIELLNKAFDRIQVVVVDVEGELFQHHWIYYLLEFFTLVFDYLIQLLNIYKED
jgi:hypothetical protein